MVEQALVADDVPPPPSQEGANAKRFVKNMMDTIVRVHISDGRILTGQLWCFDQVKNIILLNCQESRAGEELHRPLGPLVTVPGAHAVRIEALRREVEAARSCASGRMPSLRED